jgi:hypothetical protein
VSAASASGNAFETTSGAAAFVDEPATAVGFAVAGKLARGAVARSRWVALQIAPSSAMSASTACSSATAWHTSTTSRRGEPSRENPSCAVADILEIDSRF